MSDIWKNNKIDLNKEEYEALEVALTPEDELKLLFQMMKRRGWMPFTREQNSNDGLLGNIFEDLIGVVENNKRNSDYENIEIKTKNTKSNSKVTLFVYNIDSLKSASTEIRENFGSLDSESGKHIFNSCIEYSKWNTHRQGFNFKLERDKLNLYLKIKEAFNDNNITIDKNKYFWKIVKIEEFFKKIKNCCYIEGEVDKNSKTVRFDKMTIYKDADINKFWELLENDDIVVEFRIGIYKSGKNKGKTHDHGTSFRIKKNKMVELYKTKIECN